MPSDQEAGGAFYIEREGRQFGSEVRVRLVNREGGQVLHRIDGSIWTLPVWRMRWWALRHGYDWIKVEG